MARGIGLREKAANDNVIKYLFCETTRKDVLKFKVTKTEL